MGWRLKQLHRILEKQNLNGLLISHQPNITYLTGFPSADSWLLTTPKKTFFITDSRYYHQAKTSLKDVCIVSRSNSILTAAQELAKRAKIKRLGFEAKHLDVDKYQAAKKIFSPIRLISTKGLVEELRAIKSAEEINKIKKAVKITLQTLKHAQTILRPGIREIEIAAELERFIRLKGARTSSFEMIIASGKNSSFPHHQTSSRKLRKNDPLLLDIGVDYQGYKSDLTRTFFLDRIPSKFAKIYGIVCQAQTKAIKIIKPGIRISQIDKYARQHIAKQGYEGFFGHNLGHGLGLEIHEKPYICSRNNTLIKAGMIFTIEPGIYLPGEFGVRIEDNILVTNDGYEVLGADFHK